MVETGARLPAIVGSGGRATIDDVAAAAGVSRQTVSNVIRGRGRLADATRARVETAISDLSYTRHPGASSMRSRRTGQLAHLLPPRELAPGNVIALEFVRALVTAAALNDHYIVLGGSDDGTHEMRTLLDSGRIDGFIFSSVRDEDPRIQLAVDRSVPFATFGRVQPFYPQNWVDIDNADGIRQAVDHLLVKGHRSIGFLGLDTDEYWERERRLGFLDAVQAAGVDHQIHTSGTHPQALAAAASAVIDAPRRPTAVITSGDQTSAALYRAAGLAGVSIGVQLDVVGFEGGWVGRSLSPALTTVTIPVEVIAAKVIDRLVRELRSGAAVGDGGELVPLQIVLGASA